MIQVSSFSFSLLVLMWAAWLCRTTGNAFEMNLVAMTSVIGWIYGITYLIPFDVRFRASCHPTVPSLA